MRRWKLSCRVFAIAPCCIVLRVHGVSRLRCRAPRGWPLARCCRQALQE